MSELLPDYGEDFVQDLEFEQPEDQPSLTWRINTATKRVEGMVDGRQAMEQAIWKRLATERYAHLIYGLDYGFEAGGLIGESRAIVEAELPRLLTEALLGDARVEDVTDFTIAPVGRNALAVKCTARTVFGDIPMEREVTF